MGVCRMPKRNVIVIAMNLVIVSLVASILFGTGVDADPSFGTDNSDPNGTTGENFWFNISAQGSMQDPTVNYHFGDGIEISSGCIYGDGYITKRVQLPGNRSGTMFYQFRAAYWDSQQGKMVSISSSWFSSTITDNDRPTFSGDLSDQFATTGDSFTFRIDAFDNIGVNNVKVEYWYGTGSITNSTTVKGTNYTRTISVPSSMKQALNYHFWCYDQAQNMRWTQVYTRNVIDNDKPIFTDDLSDSQGTTGDTFWFRVDVEDNIGLSEVAVEFWFGSGNKTTMTMQGPSPYSLSINIPPRSLDQLHYVLMASDGSDNMEASNDRVINVIDNDHPLIDIEPINHTFTGSNLNISAHVIDNIKVSSVELYYQFETGDMGSNPMVYSSGNYFGLIEIPNDSLSPVHYWINATDSSDNWFNTEPLDALVHDDDEPVLIDDHSDTNPTTGDLFEFRAVFEDNIGIDHAEVEFWFGDGTHEHRHMTGNISSFQQSIEIPYLSTAPLNYIFHVTDHFNNTFSSHIVTNNVSDNDPPLIVSDPTQRSVQGGDMLDFQLEVFDNIGVEEAFVNFWLDDSSPQNNTLVFDGIYIYQHMVPEVGKMSYFFSVVDGSGNWMSGPVKTVEIVEEADLEPPSFGEDLTPEQIEGGTSIPFSIEVFDNDKVHIVTVEFWVSGIVPLNRSMERSGGRYLLEVPISIDQSGILNYVFHASDAFGNWVMTEERSVTIISIEDIEGPIFETDLTPKVATKGYPLTFNVEVLDPSGIGDVTVEYWFDEGIRQNVSMTELSGIYVFQITIPLSSVELHYIYHASDTNGFWSVSPLGNVELTDELDMEGPDFTEDRTPNLVEAGSLLNFVVVVEDPSGVQAVWVEYWITGSARSNITMMGNDTFNAVAYVPDIPGAKFNYRFIAVDGFGNWRSSDVVRRIIQEMLEDDEDPQILSIDFPDEILPGEGFIIEVKASDNEAIAAVIVEFWFGNGEHDSFELEETDSGFRGEIIAPDDIEEDLHFIITVEDGAGNLVSSGERTVKFSAAEESSPEPPILPVIAAVILVLLIVIILLMVFRKKEEVEEDELDWGEDDEEDDLESDEEDQEEEVEEGELDMEDDMEPPELESEPVESTMPVLDETVELSYESGVAGIADDTFTYDVKKKLGTGGFADVYLCTDAEGKKIAVKIPRKSVVEGMDKKMRKRFLAEAEHWSRLYSNDQVKKGVVGVFSYAIDPEPFLVMEYMNKGNLRKKMKKLTYDEKVELMGNMLDTLYDVHMLGVIHRDIKPENILLNNKGQWKIADWGLSKVLLDSGGSTTQAGMIKATIAYSAPEQIDSEAFGKVDRRTDIYQAGALAYELFTGTKPFEGAPALIIHRILNKTPKHPSDVKKEIPRHLGEVIMKAMSKVKKDRYRDAMVFREAMFKAAGKD